MGKIATWQDFTSEFSGLNPSDSQNKCPTTNDVSIVCTQSRKYLFQNKTGTKGNQCIQESNIDWEHNATSWSGKMHNGDKSVCTGCGLCQTALDSCPAGCFYWEDSIPYVDENCCLECGTCYDPDYGFWSLCPVITNVDNDIFWIDNHSGTIIITV